MECTEGEREGGREGGGMEIDKEKLKYSVYCTPTLLYMQ